jgi:hypothetical protein
MNNRIKKKVLEVSQIKPKKEEVKFAFQFSGVQLNAVLLFILAATFLVSGASKLGEIINNYVVIRIWLFFTIFSILVLTMSVFTTILGNAVAAPKSKRFYNMLSLTLFLLGAIVFFVSLILLLFSF